METYLNVVGTGLEVQQTGRSFKATIIYSESELMDEFFATDEPDHECLNCGMENYPTNHDCSQF